MTNLISAIDRIAFSIGNVEVAWYGILIVLGMMTGLCIVLSQCRRINLTSDDAIEFFLWVIPIAVVMGRLMYVFVRPEDYFDPDVWAEDSTQAFVDMIALWDGGITIIGGILGGFLGVVGFSIRQRKKANFGQILDLIVPALLVGQLFGRVGNFINQEAFGKPASVLGIPEAFPFSVFIDSPSGVEYEYRDMVHSNMSWQADGTYGGWFAATFFYEMCWNAIGAIIAFVVWRKNKRYPGILAFFYMLWYFLGRGLLEFVRIDAVPVTQTLCFVVVPIAVVFGVLYILFRENLLSFRRVNNANIDGNLDSTVLTKWEVDNYNFTATKILHKPNKFFYKLYGVQEFVPAEGVTVSSKEDIEEYRVEQKALEKEQRAEEKARQKENWANRWEKFKAFFAKKDKAEAEGNTENADEIGVEENKENVDSDGVEAVEDSAENEKVADGVETEECSEEFEDDNNSDRVTEADTIK